MRLADTYPLLFSVGVATASRVLPRSLASSGIDFSSQAYDYIVIGGGTAGLAVAARLSEDPNVSVGVIEAGRYLADDPMINTPALAPQLPGNPKYDWMFRSVPQPKLGGRVVSLARGKALGGSSAINMMTFDRASEVEYDAWAGLGNPGWNWTGLLPHMKAAEHFTSVDPFRVNYTNANSDDIWPSQGTKGVIEGSYNNWYSDVIIPSWNTLKNLGIPANFNPDSGDAFGVFNSASAINRTTGRRSYAASTYFAYNAHRPNFVVLTGAQATKIEFKDGTKDKGNGKRTATGVSFVYNSTSFTVKAKKEVILSAGTFQTPHLLELSGIGNSTILRQNGITPLIDLPGVGENLQDHVYVATNYELKPGHTTYDILRNNATYAANAQAQYNLTHDGIFAATPAMISFIGINSIASKAQIKNMTAQLDRETPRETSSLTKAQYEVQKDWLNKKVGQVEVIPYPVYVGTGTPKANTSYLAIMSVFQHPFSRGNIHLNTSDPLAAPGINLNWFAKSFDLDILVHSVKFAQKIAKTEPLASLVVARESPAPEVTSDADIVEYIKANARSIHHPIGTAALAPKYLGGVVDTQLKVYGTSNVRVADASIIPLHIATHTSRTVYGIGEKAAAIIKNDSS